MDFYEVVKKRMTIRDFSSKKIEEEKLNWKSLIHYIPAILFRL